MMLRGRSVRGIVLCATVLGLAVVGAVPAHARTRSATSVGSEPTGPPVFVGTYQSIATNPIANYTPESVAALKAGARAINKQGGWNGSPVRIFQCDPQEDPNKAAECARKFVDKGVVAVVGGLSVVDDQITPVLEEAGIPNVGMLPLSTPDFTSPASFPIEPGPVGLQAGDPFALAKVGKKRVYVVNTDVAAAGIIVNFVEAGTESAGLQYKGSTAFPANAADYTPYVAAAQSEDADSIVAIMSESELTSMILAATQTAADVTFATADSNLRKKTLAELGDKAEGLVATSLYPPLNAKNAKQYPVIAQHIKEMQAEFKAGDKDASPRLYGSTFTLRPWLALQVVDRLVEGLPKGESVTAAAVFNGLNTTPGIDLGIGPVLSWAQPGPVALFPRLVNGDVYLGKVKNGKYQLTQSEPIDIFEEVDFQGALGG